MQNLLSHKLHTTLNIKTPKLVVSKKNYAKKTHIML